MTITRTTPSVRTGHRHTEHDVELYRGYPQTIVRGLTDKGQRWILRNMKGSNHGRIKITHEAQDEIEALMKKDGLKLYRTGVGSMKGYDI